MASLGVVSFDVRGDAETAAKLDALSVAAQKKILRQALRPAAQLIQRATKASIRSRTGVAAESLKVRAGKRSRKFPNRVSVVVITAGGWFRGPSFYFAFDELGSRVGPRKLGNNRRMRRARHWLKRAAQSQQAAGQALVTQKIKEGIEREAKALGR